MRRRALLGGGIDYSKQYFTIVSLSDNNTIGWKASYSSLTKYISISIDNGNRWTAKKSTTSGVTLATINSGDRLLVKYYNAAFYGNSSYYNFFTSTGDFDVEGNIMSMLTDGDFKTLYTISEQYALRQLFYNCTRLKNAKNLVLPATTLANGCYSNMFSGCSGLTTAPTLPATTLAKNCYQRMFLGCTGLTSIPTNLLPATTIADSCYQEMFYGCSNITTAPYLTATTLITYCYAGMFGNCTQLNSIRMLATDISATRCLSNWVSGVAASGTFVKNSSATWRTTGVNGVPSGWTVETASS